MPHTSLRMWLSSCRFDRSLNLTKTGFQARGIENHCCSRIHNCLLNALSLSGSPSSSLPASAESFVRPRPHRDPSISPSLRIFVALQPFPRLLRCPFTRTPAPRGTCHIRRSVLTFEAPDPQLAITVGAPALDPAPGRDRACVVSPRGYGDGGETWNGMRKWVWG